MKTTVAIVALFASLAAASPAGSGNIPAHDPRDITSDGLWKRWCDGNPVQNPVCPYGAFWVRLLIRRIKGKERAVN